MAGELYGQCYFAVLTISPVCVSTTFSDCTGTVREYVRSFADISTSAATRIGRQIDVPVSKHVKQIRGSKSSMAKETQAKGISR